MLYVGDEAEKQALLLGEPRVFFTTPGYDGWPLVMLRLAEVGGERLAELVTDAWRMRAPQALAADFGAAGGQAASSAASSAPSSQQASRSAFGRPRDGDRRPTGRQPSPAAIDSTARTAPPVSLAPCTYSPYGRGLVASRHG